jgi:hypothetical protein
MSPLDDIEKQNTVLNSMFQSPYLGMSPLDNEIAKKLEAFENDMLCRKDRMLQKCNELRKFF